MPDLLLYILRDLLWSRKEVCPGILLTIDGARPHQYVSDLRKDPEITQLYFGESTLDKPLGSGYPIRYNSKQRWYL